MAWIFHDVLYRDSLVDTGEQKAKCVLGLFLSIPILQHLERDDAFS